MKHALPHDIDVEVASLVETVQTFEQLLPKAGTYNVPAAVAKRLFGALKAALHLGADLPDWPEQPEAANRWARLHSQRRHYRGGEMVTLRLTPQDTAPVAGFGLNRLTEFCQIRQIDHDRCQVEMAGYAAYLTAGRKVLAALVDFQSCEPVLV